MNTKTNFYFWLFLFSLIKYYKESEKLWDFSNYYLINIDIEGHKIIYMYKHMCANIYKTLDKV